MNQLQVIEYNFQRVLTTTQLAESYEADADYINRNFNNNKSRYARGKHYFLLEGEELREFKLTTGKNDGSLARVNKLYLWTEKGAWLHAKSLNTDKAWEAYEMLVDDYYRVKQLAMNTQAPSLELQIKQQRVEAMAINANGLKADEYGMVVLDKSPHSNKEVPTFRYNERGRKRLLELLRKGVETCQLSN